MSSSQYSSDMFLNDSEQVSGDNIVHSSQHSALVDIAVQQSLSAFDIGNDDADVVMADSALKEAIAAVKENEETEHTSSSLFIIEDYYFPDEDEELEPVLQDGFAFSTFSDRNLQAQCHTKWVSPIHNLLTDVFSVQKETHDVT